MSTVILLRASDAASIDTRDRASAWPYRPLLDRRLVGWVAFWTIGGLALRIAGARGGLWLDEAFSASFAREAVTPARVFLAINHDNNHHLNTLWLQAIGWGAPPLLARALSIVTGTLAIVVAGLFAGRRSSCAGAIAAALFAISPLIATYGMEARGYAPMLLAMVTALWLVDGWLADPKRQPPARKLGAVALFGVLSHLTFVYAFAVIGAWAGWALFRATGPAGWHDAAKRWAGLIGHALLAIALMLGLVAMAGWMSPTGFQFGSYRPFNLVDFAQGSGDMLSFALGDAWPGTTGVLAIVAVAAVIAALRWTPGLGRRRSLYAIAILLLPMGMAAARLGNANCARYYLVSGATLLLLIAEALTALIAAGGRRRLAAITALCFGALGATAIDGSILSSLRADPARAIAAIAARAPSGATAFAEQGRETPVLAVNAASLGYPLTLVDDPCEARFVFADLEQPPFPVDPVHCGHHYRPLATGYARGLSGLHWRLYERQ